MKTNAIVRIVIFSVIILMLLSILTVVLIFGISGPAVVQYQEVKPDTMIHEGSVYPEVGSNEERLLTFSAADISEMDIEWAAGSITIQTGNSDNIEIRETGGGDPFIIRQEGGKLSVKFSEIEIHWGITIEHAKDLTITVPADWICRELDIDVASSDVVISNLMITSIDFNAASGTGSFTDCTVGELDVDTASGNINFAGALDRLDCDAASADCVLVLTNVPRSIDFDGASGNLDVTLPEGSGFTVAIEGLSTDFQSDFEFTLRNGLYVCGDGSCRIEVDAMSGDLTIRKGS